MSLNSQSGCCMCGPFVSTDLIFLRVGVLLYFSNGGFLYTLINGVNFKPTEFYYSIIDSEIVISCLHCTVFLLALSPFGLSLNTMFYPLFAEKKKKKKKVSE